MGKIWLKSPDPNKQCCGCEGKTSPCDSCCALTLPTEEIDGTTDPYSTQQEAISALDNYTNNCLVQTTLSISDIERIASSFSTNNFTFSENVLDSDFLLQNCDNLPGNTSFTYSGTSIYGSSYGLITLSINLTLTPIGIVVPNPSAPDSKYYQYSLQLNGSFFRAVNPISLTDIYIRFLGGDSYVYAKNFRPGDNIYLECCSIYKFGFVGVGIPFLVYAVSSEGGNYEFQSTIRENQYMHTPQCGNSSSSGDLVLFKMGVKKDDVLTIAYNMSSNISSFLTFQLYRNGVDIINSRNNYGTTTNGSTTLSIPASENYIFLINWSSLSRSAQQAINASVDLTITSQKSLSSCAMRASYKDGEETKYVACSELP